VVGWAYTFSGSGWAEASQALAASGLCSSISGHINMNEFNIILLLFTFGGDFSYG
jgi:hypothetical protein